MPRSADHARFDRLKAIKATKLAEPALARQIDVLYLLYLEKQVDPELLKQITAKANAIEKAFNGYRATVNGRQDGRQRSAPGPQRITRPGRAQGRLGREQRRSVRSSSPT